MKDPVTGLITQWGQTHATGNKYFPVAFSDLNSVNVIAGNCADHGRYVDAPYVEITSLTSFYTRTRQSASSHGYTDYYVCWSARGY
ncbi:hypothetical protein ACMGOD_004399 [Klebsiella oxytoca]